MNAREALCWGGRILGPGRGREVARLLAAAFACRVEDLYLNPSRPLGAVAQGRYRAFLTDRLRGVPLQYLLGEAGFWSLNLKVDRRVLIPRPETEILVETALEFLRGQERPVIADIGTGSGCISLALAAELPTARILATDLSPLALEVARANAGAFANVELLLGDLMAALPAQTKLDLLVSNPPYIPTGQIPDLPPEVQAEPLAALDGGVDGLAFYRRFFRESGPYLCPGGHMLLEMGWGGGAAVRELAQGSSFHPLPFRADLAGIERLAVFRWDG